MIINPARGVTFGLFPTFVHACWAAMVAAAWAQLLINFVFWAHFTSSPYRVQAFEFQTAAILVGFVFVVGLLSGLTGAWLWNRLASRD